MRFEWLQADGDQACRRLKNLPLGLVFATGHPDRARMSVEQLAQAIHMLALERINRLHKEGPFLEGKGIAPAQVVECCTGHSQVQIALNRLDPFNVESSRTLIAAQPFTEVFDQGAGFGLGAGHVCQRGRKRSGQIEGKLAEQYTIKRQSSLAIGSQLLARVINLRPSTR